MAKKRKELPLLEGVQIETLAAEGKAIARVDGMVVFVPYAAPGDVADLQVTKKKKSFMEARLERIHSASSLRTEPHCQHFGHCGGCKWQHVSYDEQLRTK